MARQLKEMCFIWVQLMMNQMIEKNVQERREFSAGANHPLLEVLTRLVTRSDRCYHQFVRAVSRRRSRILQ